jgi:hypothetical protein
MTFAIETDYAVDAPGLTALPPCTDVAAELEALERESTSLAGRRWNGRDQGEVGAGAGQSVHECAACGIQRVE